MPNNCLALDSSIGRRAAKLVTLTSFICERVLFSFHSSSSNIHFSFSLSSGLLLLKLQLLIIRQSNTSLPAGLRCVILWPHAGICCRNALPHNVPAPPPLHFHHSLRKLLCQGFLPRPCLVIKLSNPSKPCKGRNSPFE